VRAKGAASLGCDPSDRRIALRERFAGQINLLDIPSKQGEICDLSLGGIGARFECGLSVGDRLFAQILLSSQEMKSCWVRVAWSRPEGPLDYRVGFEFAGVPRPDR